MSRFALSDLPPKYALQAQAQMGQLKHAKPLDHRPSPSSKPKQDFPMAAMVAHAREALYPARVSVCITSYRRRLLDPDNLIPKWFLDSCRHSQLIRGDSPEDITLQVTQQKVKKKEDERTEITITPIL